LGYPGPRLMATLGEAVEQRNAGVFARLVQKISAALLTGSYRYESAVWDPLQEGEGALPTFCRRTFRANLASLTSRCLIVTPNDPKMWNAGGTN